jgi:hypothetical protein
MFALVILTLLVGILTIRARVTSIVKRQISMKFYQLMEGNEVPEAITKTTRCFNNLFEVPVLFYVSATLHLSLAIEDPLSIILAWIFVAFRVAQAAIHLTYNNVYHRLFSFWLGFFTVIGLWINLMFLL